MRHPTYILVVEHAADYLPLQHAPKASTRKRKDQKKEANKLQCQINMLHSAAHLRCLHECDRVSFKQYPPCDITSAAISSSLVLNTCSESLIHGNHAAENISMTAYRRLCEFAASGKLPLPRQEQGSCTHRTPETERRAVRSGSLHVHESCMFLK